MVKKILLLCLTVILLTSMAQALMDPPELIIVEKPDYVDISYGQGGQGGLLIIKGLDGHEVQLVKSPLQEGSEKKTQLEEELRDGFVFIMLLNMGDYEMVVDGEQSIKFSIGKEIIEANIHRENMKNQLLYSGIGTIILGTLLLLATVILRTKKTWKITAIAIIAIGAYLLLNYWIYINLSF